MNIYAIKDRLLNYFMDPFAGRDDKLVQAAMAKHINGDSDETIVQTPHYFEIWRLGHVDDQGHITPHHEFITNCSTLVRSQRPTAEPSPGTAPETIKGRHSEPGPTPGHTPPETGAAQSASQAAPDVPGAPHPRPGRMHRLRD